MRNIQARILALLLAALMLLGLTACGEEIAGLTENVFSEPGITETAVSEETPDEPELPDAPEADPGTSDSAVTEGAYYYDLEHVVLYLDRYGVPSRTITSRRTRPAHSAGRAAASKTDLDRRGHRRRPVRQTAKACSRRRRAAATPNATSTQTANRAAAQSGWSFRTTASIFYTEDHYETFDELYVTETQEVAWK